MKTDVLALAAHPDDTELCCSGTIAKLVQQGKKVAVVDLTRGEMGTRGTPEQRLDEAEKAAGILGLAYRDNLGLPDTELKNSRKYQVPIIRKIRYYRPHVCLINAPSDRHPDHGDAATLQADAIFYSGLGKIKTKGTDGKPQSPHRPAHILHYMQNQPFEPDFVFDITDTIEIKEKAIRAFASQFDVQDPGDEPQTYVSDPEFFKFLRARAREYGHLAGFTYGEPFKYVRKPVPISSFDLFDQTSPTR